MKCKKVSSAYVYLIVLAILSGIFLPVACSPVSNEEVTEKISTPSTITGTTSMPPPTTNTPTPVTTTTTTPVPETTTTPAPDPDRSAAYIYELNPELTPVNYDSPALLLPSEDMGQEYIDRMTFICDSPTYWLWPLELLSDGKLPSKSGPDLKER